VQGARATAGIGIAALPGNLGNWALSYGADKEPIKIGVLLSLSGTMAISAIGRAILSNPKLLLLDEPTEGIQPSIVDQIEDVIIGFKTSRRFAILLVEQGLHFAASLAGKYVVMAKGAVVAAGKRDELSAEMVKQHLTVWGRSCHRSAQPSWHLAQFRERGRPGQPLCSRPATNSVEVNETHKNHCIGTTY
jgi:ABC-type glutathione transport system ATPase component